MSQIKHGEVTVDIPDTLAIPNRAGKLSPDDVKAIPKPPRGLGTACASAAQAMRNADGKFMAPAGVTADGLEKAGDDADHVDQIIASVEVVLATLKQANLLLDAAAWEQLRKVNDQVQAQGKTSPDVHLMFAPLHAFMQRMRSVAHAPDPQKKA